MAEVVLWTPDSGEVEVIGETTTWNFQQGARAMWLPGGGNQVLFNKRVGGQPGAEIVDIDSGERRELPHAVGHVAPDGSYGFAPNFARLGKLWPAYGYSGFDDPFVDESQPYQDGLWRIDIESGARELMFSIPDLVALTNGAIGSEIATFVTHVSFNREGTRIVFMMRFFSKDYALYSLIYSADVDGNGLRLLAQEKISHFDWTSEDEIVVWMRKIALGVAAARRSGLLASPFLKPLVNIARKFKGKMRSAMLNESYFSMSVAGGSPEPWARGILQRDGHPMISPDRKWMIVDEYPMSDGTTPLMLVDMATCKRIEVATFMHDVGTPDRDMKCDLHPRWDRKGTQVGVDATNGGRRCFTIVDVADLMTETA
ncbi:MAG: hypothetical protein JXQ91_09575 [Vannielia sp.]|uniref:hypothetical protein n=1 Tax=Vannielia sp. TaxID=2813045 RepID=UPI003B8E72C2